MHYAICAIRRLFGLCNMLVVQYIGYLGCAICRLFGLCNMLVVQYIGYLGCAICYTITVLWARGKMAPVLATCRLSPLFLSLVAQNVNPLLVYDRQALVDIQLSAKDLVKSEYGYKTLPPSSIGDPILPVPTHSSTSPAETLPPQGETQRTAGEDKGPP